MVSVCKYPKPFFNRNVGELVFFWSSPYFISCTLESNSSRHFKLIPPDPSYNL